MNISTRYVYILALSLVLIPSLVYAADNYAGITMVPGQVTNPIDIRASNGTSYFHITPAGQVSIGTNHKFCLDASCTTFFSSNGTTISGGSNSFAWSQINKTGSKLNDIGKPTSSYDMNSQSLNNVKFGNQVNLNGQTFNNGGHIIAYPTNSGTLQLNNGTFNGYIGPLLGINGNLTVTKSGFPNNELDAGSGIETSTYVIGISGSKYFLKNGQTGQIIESSSSGDTILVDSLNLLKTNCGKLTLKAGLYNYTTPVSLSVTNTCNPIFEGEGQNTILRFTGTGYGLSLNNTGTNKAHSAIRDLKMDAVTITNGRSCFTTTGNGSDTGDYLTNVYFRNCDDAVTIKNTNGFSMDHFSIVDANRGIITKGGVLSVATGNTFTTGDIQFVTGDCILFNGDGSAGVNNYFSNIIFESCGTAFEGKGSTEQLVLRNLYIEGTTGNQDILLSRSYTDAKFDSIRSNSAIRDMVTLNNTGSNGMTFTNMDATSITDSMFYIIADTQYRLLIENPKIPSTKFLFNSTIGLPGSPNDRIFGTVINQTATGTIVSGATTFLLKGDVVVFTGQNLLSSTTTQGARGTPSVVMIGNQIANSPAVIYNSGVGQVNIKSGVVATFGDTLVTSSTARRADVNNTETNPAKILGFTTQTAAAGGITYFMPR